MNFHFNNEIFIVVVALLIVAGICLGLLIALAIFILRKQGNPPPVITTTPPASNQSKRIANSTVAMSAGLSLLILAVRMVIPDRNIGYIILFTVVGIGAVIYAWVNWTKI
jgi:hypothetical protein